MCKTLKYDSSVVPRMMMVALLVYFNNKAAFRYVSNIPKTLPKIFSGISQNFHLLCSSVFPCLHFAPWLETFLTIILISECSIRIFHYKVTVLLESINLREAVDNAFECSTVVFSFHWLLY